MNDQADSQTTTVMDNIALYCRWFEQRSLSVALCSNMVIVDGPAGIKQIIVEGHRGSDDESGGTVRGTLPLIRGYWKTPFLLDDKELEAQIHHEVIDALKSKSQPPWKSETWMPLSDRHDAWIRYFRADQALDFLSWLHPPERDPVAFSKQVRKALETWFVSIDNELIEQVRVLASRIDTIKLSLKVDKRDGLRTVWSRQLASFGNEIRASLYGYCSSTSSGVNVPSDDMPTGLDPVHTPENSRAGLVRYLSRGWRISDNGWLTSDQKEPPVWGEASYATPYRLHNTPRRLMLGASLQTRAVNLLSQDEPCEKEEPIGWFPAGRKLFAVFSTFSGWTHEDAFVISESAAIKLTAQKTQRIDIFIPRLANRVEVIKSGVFERGQKLVRAFVDLFAFGYRPHEIEGLCEKKGWDVDDGWLEFSIPRATLMEDATIVDITRRETHGSARNRELITFHMELSAPVSVGDKLATPHGIKGVVSRILPDDQMPDIDGQRAEVILSHRGIIRRGAMGQFHEALNNGHATSLPRSGNIFVTRQPQNSSHPDRFRILGAKKRVGDVRGQRYGEMEFWALMAHGANSIAKELLSFERSTAYWMRKESEANDGEIDHRKLASSAVNHYLGIAGMKTQGPILFVQQSSNGKIAVPPAANAFEIVLPNGPKDIKDWLEELDSEKKFVAGKGLGFIRLPRPVEVTFRTGHQKDSPVVCLDVSAVHILPPWLRPPLNGEPHDLTDAYAQLVRSLLSVREDQKQKLPSRVRKCIAIALGARWGRKGMSGVDVFLRREVLGRRLTRSARAVIVPDPSLRIDQIRIPAKVTEAIFEDLPEDSPSRQIVLVNRNPTLQRRGLLALRPVVDYSGSTVFGLPLGVLKTLAADFDGDQASVVALCSGDALREAEDLLLPGSKGMRSDPFLRHKQFLQESKSVAELGYEPAFPLVKEMSTPDAERSLASLASVTQLEWVSKHKDLVDDRIDNLGDGWESPYDSVNIVEAMKETIDKSKDKKKRNELGRLLSFWQGKKAEDWIKFAEEEMEIVYTSVRKKGRYGGVLRRQLYRRPFTTFEQFRKSIEALHAVTEPLVQAALSCKSGDGTFKFPIEKFFKEPSKNVAALMEIAPVFNDSGEEVASQFDEATLCEFLGESVDPQNLLAWLAKPSFQALLSEIATSETSTDDKRTYTDDPRLSWFLE